MRYAIRNQDGSFRVDLIGNLLPHVSFAGGEPTDAWLQSNDVFRVVDYLTSDGSISMASVEPYLLDGEVYTVESRVLDLADVKSLRTAEIVAAAEAALAALAESYPRLEVATWSQQIAEAQAISGDAAVETPMLSAISTSSGISKEELAASILAKATAYKSAAGAIVGKRLALTEAIAQATTALDVLAVTWDRNSSN